MSRLHNFHTLKTHPWFGKLYAKLTSVEVSRCEEFITRHEQCDDDEYALTVIRSDRSRDKKSLIINELLLVAGTMNFKRSKEC